ncbi:unnamed protein product, partial [Urochloa humidicola]
RIRDSAAAGVVATGLVAVTGSARQPWEPSTASTLTARFGDGIHGCRFNAPDPVNLDSSL